MIIKYFNKTFLINLSLIISIFILDRISKVYVIYLDKKLLGSEIFSSKFLNIYLIWNKGVAFGLFSLDDIKLYNIFTILILIIILVIIFMILKSDGLKKYALLFILGGALGNFFDRFFYKGVPDFIDFHVGDYHWFIFNLADIFISLGVIFLILFEFFNNNQKNYD